MKKEKSKIDNITRYSIIGNDSNVTASICSEGVWVKTSVAFDTILVLEHEKESLVDETTLLRNERDMLREELRKIKDHAKSAMNAQQYAADQQVISMKEADHLRNDLANIRTINLEWAEAHKINIEHIKQHKAALIAKDEEIKSLRAQLAQPHSKTSEVEFPKQTIFEIFSVSNNMLQERLEEISKLNEQLIIECDKLRDQRKEDSQRIGSANGDRAMLRIELDRLRKVVVQNTECHISTINKLRVSEKVNEEGHKVIIALMDELQSLRYFCKSMSNAHDAKCKQYDFALFQGVQTILQLTRRLKCR